MVPITTTTYQLKGLTNDAGVIILLSWLQSFFSFYPITKSMKTRAKPFYRQKWLKTAHQDERVRTDCIWIKGNSCYQRTGLPMHTNKFFDKSKHFVQTAHGFQHLYT